MHIFLWHIYICIYLCICICVYFHVSAERIMHAADGLVTHLFHLAVTTECPYWLPASSLVKVKQLRPSLLCHFGLSLSWLSNYKHAKYTEKAVPLGTETRVGFVLWNLGSVCCNQVYSESEACGTKYVLKIVSLADRSSVESFVSSLVPLWQYKSTCIFSSRLAVLINISVPQGAVSLHYFSPETLSVSQMKGSFKEENAEGIGI